MAVSTATLNRDALESVLALGIPAPRKATRPLLPMYRKAVHPRSKEPAVSLLKALLGVNLLA